MQKFLVDVDLDFQRIYVDDRADTGPGEAAPPAETGDTISPGCAALTVTIPEKRRARIDQYRREIALRDAHHGA